jgi:hypothetical protein
MDLGPSFLIIYPGSPPEKENFQMDPKNWIELNMPKDEEAFVLAAAEKFKTVHHRTIDNVFEWAKAIAILQSRHYGSGVQGAFAAVLAQYGFTNRDGGPIDASIRRDFITLRENEPAVREWWASVPEKKKREWLSARAIARHWRASLKQRDPDAKREPSPIAKERATNVALQEALHSANERLKTADGGNLFDIDRDSAEMIGRTFAQAWASSPTKIETLIKTLSEALPEVKRLHRAARPRPRGRRPTVRSLKDGD